LSWLEREGSSEVGKEEKKVAKEGMVEVEEG
jgi:translation elongation factor EF-Ts